MTDSNPQPQIRSLMRYPVAPHGLCVTVGFEPTKHFASDLKSDPFDRSGTLPKLRRLGSNQRPTG